MDRSTYIGLPVFGVVRNGYVLSNSARDSLQVTMRGGAGVRETISRAVVSYVISTILGPSARRASFHIFCRSSRGRLPKTVNVHDCPLVARTLLVANSLKETLNGKIQIMLQNKPGHFQQERPSTLSQRPLVMSQKYGPWLQCP